MSTPLSSRTVRSTTRAHALEIVGDDDRRAAPLPRRSASSLVHAGHPLIVEARVGLIEQEQSHRPEVDARERDAPLLSSREVPPALVRLVREPDVLERRVEPLRVRGFPRHPAGEMEVLDHGEVLVDTGRVPDHRGDLAHPAGVGPDVAAIDRCGAARRPQRGGDRPHERALAAPVAAHERDHLSRLDAQRDAAESPLHAEAVGDAGALDGGDLAGTGGGAQWCLGGRKTGAWIAETAGVQVVRDSNRGGVRRVVGISTTKRPLRPEI